MGPYWRNQSPSQRLILVIESLANHRIRTIWAKASSSWRRCQLSRTQFTLKLFYFSVVFSFSFSLSHTLSFSLTLSLSHTLVPSFFPFLCLTHSLIISLTLSLSHLSISLSLQVVLAVYLWPSLQKVSELSHDFSIQRCILWQRFLPLLCHFFICCPQWSVKTRIEQKN